MTTNAWVGFLDHSSDTGFRAWASELGDPSVGQFVGIGLVQTADTGQINLTTTTRTGTNTAAGYQIWRFADSTLYMKIEYGTGGSTTQPAIWITVGTGSNGSGTLTGQTSTRNIFTNQTTPTSTTTNYTSRICRVTDAFALDWKEASTGASNNAGFLVVGKSVDGTGAATTTGFGVLRCTGVSGSVSFQSVRTATTATTFNDTFQTLCVPGAPTGSSTASNGNQQAYQISMNIPEVQPFAWANIVFIAEAGRGVSFPTTMVGSVSHTYVSPGSISASTFNAYSSGLYTAAMIYE